MKCDAKCENVKHQMGDYLLTSSMFALEMGDCDAVLYTE
jgi:hypothetical protein